MPCSGIYHQDAYMQNMYAAYPEVLLVDATYKLSDLRMPLYIMMAVDGNGLGEIVCMFLVTDETEPLIGMALQTFQQHNAAWTKTTTVLTDKDSVERNVFRTLFPSVSLIICLFHTLRTFRREITCEKMKISSAQRGVCLGIVRDMVYSSNEQQYNVNNTHLQATGCLTVVDYITKSWHPIRSEWVEGLKAQHFTLGETTNNWLESINQKIKTVCTRHSRLQRFFTEVMQVIVVLRNERMHKALMMCTKRPTVGNDNQLAL